MGRSMLYVGSKFYLLPESSVQNEKSREEGITCENAYLVMFRKTYFLRKFLFQAYKQLCILEEKHN